MKYALALGLVAIGGTLVYDGFKGRQLWTDVLNKIRSGSSTSVSNGISVAAAAASVANQKP